MSLFDSKEEVIELVLTGYGKHKLSIGEFDGLGVLMAGSVFSGVSLQDTKRAQIQRPPSNIFLR